MKTLIALLLFLIPGLVLAHPGHSPESEGMWHLFSSPFHTIMIMAPVIILGYVAWKTLATRQ